MFNFHKVRKTAFVNVQFQAFHFQIFVTKTEQIDIVDILDFDGGGEILPRI